MRNEVTRANAVSERKKSTKELRQTAKQKKIARQVLTYNSKKFPGLNKKTRPRAYNWKTISKLGSNKKGGLKGTMKGLENPFRKKFYPKNSKNQSEIAT